MQTLPKLRQASLHQLMSLPPKMILVNRKPILSMNLGFAQRRKLVIATPAKDNGAVSHTKLATDQ